MTLPSMRTIADGIAVGRPGDVTFAQVAAQVDDVLTVGEDALSRALLHCLERAKLVVEPAGAAGVAALMEQPATGSPPRWSRCCPAGNIDPLVLLHVIQHGMAAAGALPHAAGAPRRRPGALAGLLTLVGDRGGNVLDVAHARTSVALPLGEVDVRLSMETRGPQHCAELVAAIQAAGHTVVDETRA